MLLALIQALLHIYNDTDGIFNDAINATTDTAPKPRPQIMVKPPAQLINKLPSLLQSVVTRSLLVGFIGGPFMYGLFMRRTAWSWSLFLARIVWDIPAVPELSYIPPYHILLIFRTTIWGFFLSFLWDVSNAAFTAYISQEPLKNGKPLTDDNRSLMNGLNAKKEMTKAFAFWELALLQRFADRRKMIYDDFDRPDGSAWTQIETVCLNNLISMTNRIALFQNPDINKPPPLKEGDLQSLPRLSTPLRQEPILQNPLPPTTRLEKFETKIGSFAKSYGNSPPPNVALTPLEPRSKQYLDSARQKLLTQGQQETLTPTGIYALFNEYLMQFIRSSLGMPFRQKFRRRICAVVLGTPYSELSIIVDSITALSSLACSSVVEDNFGNVNKDVHSLIRTFSGTCTTLENFLEQTPPHWTDVQFQKQDRKVEEVEIVLEVLKSGLKEMVRTFGVYAVELRIGEGELRMARTIAGMDEE
jgi:nucleoporin NDC1